MRERTGLLDMSWILTLVHLSRETTQDKVELPLHSHTLWAIPAFMVKYRSKKPETTQNLLSLKKKERKKKT